MPQKRSRGGGQKGARPRFESGGKEAFSGASEEIPRRGPERWKVSKFRFLKINSVHTNIFKNSTDLPTSPKMVVFGEVGIFKKKVMVGFDGLHIFKNGFGHTPVLPSTSWRCQALGAEA